MSPFRFTGGPLGCLLIHGFTGSPEEMRYLGDRLHRAHGFTVEGVGLAGHGLEASSFQERGWPDWYRSAEQGFQRLQRDCAAVNLIGFSMGGLIALLLALNHGERVNRLALLATPLFQNRHKARLAACVYRLPFTRAGMAWFYGGGVNGPMPHRTDLTPAEASLAQLKWLMRRAGAGLRTPALILHSRRDPSVPWENAMALSRLTGGGSESLVLMSRSRHVLPLDLERERVVREVAAFFRRGS